MLLAFEILLLAVHLACMNVAAGAPLVALWLEWKDRRGDAIAPQAARYLGSCSIVAIVAGVLLGLLLGWLRWTPQLQTIWLEQLAHKLRWGILEIGFALALLVVYWVWRRSAVLPTRWGFIGRSCLLLLTSTNLLYHFPPLLIVANKLADGMIPREIELPDNLVTPSVFRQLMLLDETPALTVHFALASIAMGGIALLGLASRRLKTDLEPRGARRIASWGGWSALVPTGLQLLVGLWLLVTTPPDMQAQVTGAAWAPSICLGVSLLCVVWLLRELADVTLGEPTRGGMIRSMVAMSIVIVLMTAARQLSRPTAERALDQSVVQQIPK